VKYLGHIISVFVSLVFEREKEEIFLFLPSPTDWTTYLTFSLLFELGFFVNLLLSLVLLLDFVLFMCLFRI
jgi:hypothetical protein